MVGCKNMSREIDEVMCGWLDGVVGVKKDGGMCGCIRGGMGGWFDGEMNGETDERMDG